MIGRIISLRDPRLWTALVVAIALRYFFDWSFLFALQHENASAPVHAEVGGSEPVRGAYTPDASVYANADAGLPAWMIAGGVGLAVVAVGGVVSFALLRASADEEEEGAR